MRRALVGLLAVWLWVGPVAAQDDDLPATLVADAIRFDRPTETIIASGTVEVFFDGAVLQAQTVRYDGRADVLTVEGPLVFIDETGRTVFFADLAELSGDLQNAMLRSARLVLDRQLQIAAAEIDRVDGRFTQAFQTVATTCEVCAENPRPLWEIRARRIVHDLEARTIWFEDAQFRAFGVPVAYFPRLRLPDPTQERAPGFLVPRLFGNDQLGTGLAVPYFVPIGPHRDITFAPYLTTDGYSGLGLRYREAFRTGWIEANSQLSFDDLTDDDVRGYVFADGFFFLPRDFELQLQVQAVTDRGYLSTYGIVDLDRLESFAIARRTERDLFIEAAFTQYTSLRDGESNATLPNSIFDSEWTRRFALPGEAGIADLSFQADLRVRSEDSDGAGRDVGRIGAEAGWRGDWIAPLGVVLAAEAELYADVFFIDQDSSFEPVEARVAPFAGVEVSWPFGRVSPAGVSHLITPTVQLAWSDDGGATIPNEDSTIVSFDQGNLFALNRFPGSDRRETGARLTFGIGYTRTDPLGWSLGTIVGRVVRDEDATQFSEGSGLDGARSDWLIGVNLTLGRDLSMATRALVDDAMSLTSSETALTWTGERHALDSSITWLAADPAEGRPDDTAELFLQGEYDFGRGWSADAAWRYDFAEDESTRAALGIAYATECIEVQFSLSRRFTSSTNVAPSTEFGLTVALNGFGANRSGRSQDRVCVN